MLNASGCGQLLGQSINPSGTIDPKNWAQLLSLELLYVLDTTRCAGRRHYIRCFGPSRLDSDCKESKLFLFVFRLRCALRVNTVDAVTSVLSLFYGTIEVQLIEGILSNNRTSIGVTGS